MKLLRYGDRGRERPGILGGDGVVRDLSGHIADIDEEALSPRGLERLRAIDLTLLPEVAPGARIGAPVGVCRKCLAIGANYMDHIAESGAPPPGEPIIFSKSDTAVSGPYDDVARPPGASKLDWEVELTVVIGSVARHVECRNAHRHIAGYALGIDYSERAYQHERDGQWIKGKACDTFAPLGPWLVTADEIPDPQRILLWLEVNGVRRQECSTSKMIADCATLVSYCSSFMTLRPGDAIMTGTPSGVGGAMDPPVFLQPGDVVRAGGTGLGEQLQTIVDWKDWLPV